MRFAGSVSEPSDRPPWRQRYRRGCRGTGQLNVLRSRVYTAADIKLSTFNHSLVEVRIHPSRPLEEFPGLVLAG
jgi:hypothetical protein